MLLRFFVRCVFSAIAAKLLNFKLLVAFLSAAEVVVTVLAILAAHCDYYSVAHISLPLYVILLFRYFCNNAGAYSVSALSYGKTQLRFHRDRGDKLYVH